MRPLPLRSVCASRLVAALAFSFAPLLAHATTVDAVREQLTEGACAEARRAVESAADSDDFLSSAYGKMLYGGSICCSPVTTLNDADIAAGENYLNAARAALGESMQPWIDRQLARCEDARQSLATGQPTEMQLVSGRSRSFTIASNSIGKAMGECRGQQNLSPVMATDRDRQANFVAIVPDSDGNIAPPADYLASLTAAYAAGEPQVQVCPPFIALSATQPAEDICRAAQGFMGFFQAEFDATAPLAWLALYHYESGTTGMRDHMRKSGQDLNCDSTLGFYNWQRQQVVWRAPPGYFGTFNHELAHALMFWDAPMSPRWFDEGVAALYENSRLEDGRYTGIANPWREEQLRRMGKDSVSPRDLLKVIELSPLQFESSPRNSTIAREVIRQDQDCGHLPVFYRAMRIESRSQQALDSANDAFYQPYPEARRAVWRELVNSLLRGDACP